MAAIRELLRRAVPTLAMLLGGQPFLHVNAEESPCLVLHFGSVDGLLEAGKSLTQLPEAAPLDSFVKTLGLSSLTDLKHFDKEDFSRPSGLILFLPDGPLTDSDSRVGFGYVTSPTRNGRFKFGIALGSEKELSTRRLKKLEEGFYVSQVNGVDDVFFEEHEDGFVTYARIRKHLDAVRPQLHDLIRRVPHRSEVSIRLNCGDIPPFWRQHLRRFVESLSRIAHSSHSEGGEKVKFGQVANQLIYDSAELTLNDCEELEFSLNAKGCPDSIEFMLRTTARPDSKMSEALQFFSTSESQFARCFPKDRDLNAAMNIRATQKQRELLSTMDLSWDQLTGRTALKAITDATKSNAEFDDLAAALQTATQMFMLSGRLDGAISVLDRFSGDHVDAVVHLPNTDLLEKPLQQMAIDHAKQDKWLSIEEVSHESARQYHMDSAVTWWFGEKCLFMTNHLTTSVKPSLFPVRSYDSPADALLPEHQSNSAVVLEGRVRTALQFVRNQLFGGQSLRPISEYLSAGRFRLAVKRDENVLNASLRLDRECLSAIVGKALEQMKARSGQSE